MNGQTPREVYFLKPVGMDGPIKIGCGFEPRERLGAYTAWSPYPLEIILTIPGSLDLERNIQDCFLDCHSHSEWFHASPRLLAAIADMQAGVRPEEAIDLSKRLGSLHGAKIKQALALVGTPQERHWR
jgi:hypothetical protein